MYGRFETSWFSRYISHSITMLCPNCLSLMTCESAINPVPGQPGKDRMDLHCSRRCRARCHMGVITEDPKNWVCHDYGFSFKVNNETYYMVGFDYLVDPYHQHRDPTKRKTILSNLSESMLEVEFIPLPTGDNMHEEAWRLFERLKKLVVFS